MARSWLVDVKTKTERNTAVCFSVVFLSGNDSRPFHCEEWKTESISMVSQDGPLYVYILQLIDERKQKPKSTLHMAENENEFFFFWITGEKRIRIVFHVLSWIRMVYSLFHASKRKGMTSDYMSRMSIELCLELNSFYRFRLVRSNGFKLLAVTSDDGKTEDSD